MGGAGTADPQTGHTGTGNAAALLGVVVGELQQGLGLIGPEQADALVEAILSARSVFVAGAGRSGLMARAFAMRLIQMGFSAYVVGETTTPGIGEGDLLLVASGSGETATLISMARKAGGVGAAVALVTIPTTSTLAELADVRVNLPGAVKDGSGSYRTVQPMASLFEQTLLLFLDAVILDVMARRGLDSGGMYGRHANLE